MQTIFDIEAMQCVPCAATVGFFDGVHRGHRFLLDELKKHARENGLATMVITFGAHPRSVVRPEFCPRLLTTTEEKIELLSTQDIDYCVILPFTYEMAQLDARDFMQKVLYDRLNVRLLLTGYDNRFGHNRSEGFDDYVVYGQEMGMKVCLATSFLEVGIRISSSEVRRFVADGDVEAASRCLGRNYSVSGVVGKGFRQGRKIGFPTANVQSPPEVLLPKNGAYAAYALFDGIRHDAMLNIGVRPTMNNGSNVSLEVYVVDFEGDLYGKSMTVEFVKRLRDERRFGSVDELAFQLNDDLVKTKEILR